MCKQFNPSLTDKQNIIQSYLNGDSLNVIGNKFNCTGNTIAQLLKRNNIQLRAKKDFAQIKIDMVKVYIEEKIEIELIAKRFEVSSEYARKIIGAAGVIRDDEKYALLNKNKEEVLSMCRDGIANKVISKKFGVSMYILARFLDRYGLKSKYAQIILDGNPENYKDEILKKFTSGDTLAKIAKELNLHYDTISKYLRGLGYDTNQQYNQYNNYDHLGNEIQNIIDMYQRQITIENIAKQYNEKYGQIKRILVDNNIKIRKRADIVYPVDETYFEKIDTANKAYILGLFLADGCVCSKLNSFKISLKYNDKYILDNIKEEMKYEGDLLRVPGKVFLGVNKELCVASPQYCLSVGRMKMCKDLVRLGCIPNKTWLIRFPTEEQMPREFISDFIRGYWDGDGTISKRNPCLSLIGNQFFVKELLKYLPLKELPQLYYRQSIKYKDDSDKKTITCCIGIKHGCKEVFNFLYGDCGNSLYLRRKRELALHWLNKLS